MPKNKGGRSIKPTLTKFSPHPRIDLQTLRGLGATEQDIREFRQSQRNIEKIVGDINAYSRKHGVTQMVGFIDYPTAIELTRKGVADLREITEQTIKEIQHFKETGRSFQFDAMVQKDIDEINLALGDDFLTFDLVMKLSHEEQVSLSAGATQLYHYRKLAEEAEQRGDFESAEYYWQRYYDIADQVRIEIVNYKMKYGGE